MGLPEFVVYRLVALLFGARPVEVPAGRISGTTSRALARAVTPRTKLVIVSTPNNPTGTANTEEELLALHPRAPRDGHLRRRRGVHATTPTRPPDIRPLIARGPQRDRAADVLEDLRPRVAADRLRVRERRAGVAPRQGPPAVQRERGRAGRGRRRARRQRSSRGCACARTGRGSGASRRDSPSSGSSSSRARRTSSSCAWGTGRASSTPSRAAASSCGRSRPYDLPEWIRVTVGTAEQNERFLRELAAVRCADLSRRGPGEPVGKGLGEARARGALDMDPPEARRRQAGAGSRRAGVPRAAGRPLASSQKTFCAARRLAAGLAMNSHASPAAAAGDRGRQPRVEDDGRPRAVVARHLARGEVARAPRAVRCLRDRDAERPGELAPG